MSNIQNHLIQSRNRYNGIYHRSRQIGRKDLWSQFRKLLEVHVFCRNFGVSFQELVEQAKTNGTLKQIFGDDDSHINNMLLNYHNCPSLLVSRCENNETFHNMLMLIYSNIVIEKAQDFIDRMNDVMNELEKTLALYENEEEPDLQGRYPNTD